MYKPFKRIIFRTPAFSYEKWQEYILQQQNGKYDDLLNDDYFLEAIFIASPVLYDEIVKYKAGKLPKKEEERLFSSLMRYLTRMSWRCTPFGLFSGCSVGKLSERNEIILPETMNFKRCTRLDMNYLCALIQNISQKEEIKSLLKFYPNTSLYYVGNQLRYVEYTFINTHRKHNIISVDKNEYLQQVLQSAENGQTIDFLANLLVKDDIAFDEAKEFILELIDSQLLVSELEPTVTGKDILDILIENLIVINKDFSTITQLVEIQEYLKNINHLQIGSNISLYDNIIAIVKSIGVSFDSKFLFQTDVFKTPITANISYKIINEIWATVTFLNKLFSDNINPNLNNFIKAFYNRFEEKEMPLLIVLDNEIGIGYPVGKEGDITLLLRKFIIPNSEQPNRQQIEWSNVQAVLHKKFLEAHVQKKYEIYLNDTDFTFKAENWTDTPDSFSVMCKIFSVKEEQPLIFLSSFGGSSAANLLARFAHTDKEIEEHVLIITQKESELQKDAILAEIVHLPESRIGNIIFRPIIRHYEIPYLAKSAVEKEFQIPLSDLFVSVRGNQIFLRSKRLNKRIIPRLTNAHNYSTNAMPVYHFLCDLQTYNQRAHFGLNWSNLTNDYDFLPRVIYKNVILSLARWIIKTEDLKKLISDNSVEKITLWCKEKLMPRYMFLPDGDNAFFVDMENILSINNLLGVVKQRKQFYLEEFPFDFDNILVVDNKGNKYTNELIINFYKEKE
jgi:hypothetical protein